MAGENIYPHDVWCNASRHQPVGCSGCSCTAGREIASLRAENERLKKELEQVKRPTRYHNVEEFYKDEEEPK